MMPPALELKDVRRVFRQGEQRLEVLNGIDLALVPGEVVALVGPSGSGKSTLLQLAGLLERPDSGEILIQGQATSRLDDRGRTRLRRHALGFVYQFHHLLPEFTALENVALPQRLAGQGRRAATERAVRLLSDLGLAGRLEHRPAKLSGGEQQRVAIARAFANAPRVILADEPTGNLDERTASQVLAAFLEFAHGHGTACLVATHNLDLASRMDRGLRLHEGRAVAADLPPGDRPSRKPPSGGPTG